MNFSRIALTTSMLALAACADTGQLPSAPDQADMVVSGEPNFVQSISGNADIDTPYVPGVQPGGLRRMVIQARKEADGTVTGTLTIRQEWEGGSTLEAEVTCLTIDGNKARVGAVLTSTDGVPTPTYVALRIMMIDNGEGQAAAPDQASQAQGTLDPAQPQIFCNNPLAAFPMLDLVRGNLQIR